MPNRKIILTLAAILMMISTALTTSQAASQQKNSNILTTRSSRASYQVRCKPSVQPMPFNELFNLTVTVYENGNTTKPLTDVTLSVDAAMPEHNHGMMVDPKITRNDDGSFAVEGMQFHMSGKWELYLDITRAGITERTLYKLDIQ